MRRSWLAVLLFCGCAATVPPTSPPAASTPFEIARATYMDLCSDCSEVSLLHDPAAGWGHVNIAGRFAVVHIDPEHEAMLRLQCGDTAVLGLYDHEFGHVLSLGLDQAIDAAPLKLEWELRSDAWAGCMLAAQHSDPGGLVCFLGDAEGTDAHPPGPERVTAVLAGFDACR